MAEAKEAKRHSIRSLLAEQVEAIEIDLELPMDRWDEAPSKAVLYTKVLAAITGEPEERFRKMRMSDLVAMVTLGDEEEEEDPNP